jgi:iron complex outermembrane receptor protein
MKNKITHLGMVLLCLCFNTLLAQQTGTIAGKIIDNNQEPVSFANVILKSAADSSLVKVEYTHDDGTFQMINITPGEYWVTVSYVGLNPYRTAPFQLADGQNIEMPTINMKTTGTDLQEVTVTAEKPLLELKPDKMVLNVEGSINASGSTALELMRKSPGVIVDNNDNISLLGKSSVQVYIDGKPSPLGGADLAAFLKSIQSTEIESIEIITNPSAKFDAEGNGGIINIRMKKDKRLGTNANVNLGYSVGEVAQYNSSVSGNYRNKKMNAFGSFSYNDGRNVNFMNLYREQFGGAFDQRGNQFNAWDSYNFKAGSDFFLTKKSTLGFLVNGFMSDNTGGGDTRTLISKIGAPSVDSILQASTSDTGERNNLNFNLNYQFEDEKGNTVNVDADYGQFRNTNAQLLPNTYLDPGGENVLFERINANETPTNIDIYTFKVDYERPLLGGQLGAGGKIAFVNTDNTFNFFQLVDNEKILETDVSNQFQYEENVNAAYFSFARKFGKKWNLSLGLRMEQTNSTGDLTSYISQPIARVDTSYLNFFPSGGITFTPSQKHSFALNYSRRINRPSYQDLNPFELKLDELTFQKGNPFLRPEYANNVQLTYSFNYRLNVSLNYSHTQNLITRITDASSENAAFITWVNLADQYNYSLNISAPMPITKWWSSYTSLTGFNTQNKADYGEGRTVDLNVSTFNIYSQHTFRLPKGWSMELSGWYNSPSAWGGTFEMESMWNMDFGVQKKLMDGRANLKVSVSDIFKTTNWTGRAAFGPLFMNINGGWDSRRLRVNFSYLLGNTQVKGARKRKTGLEEEQRRANSGGN